MAFCKEPNMTDELRGHKVAILATDGVERVELEQPRGALHGVGAETVLLSLHDGEINARQTDSDPAGTFTVDRKVADASVGDYDALVLPGGTMNPDRLRMDPDAVAFVKAFMESGKPVATICHGPWTLVEADVLRGRRLTSWPSIRTDLRNAGAQVVDEEVVVDGQLISSRGPKDLPAFCNTVIDELAKATRPAWDPTVER
jgi:protease I